MARVVRESGIMYERVRLAIPYAWVLGRVLPRSWHLLLFMNDLIEGTLALPTRLLFSLLWLVRQAQHLSEGFGAGLQP